MFTKILKQYSSFIISEIHFDNIITRGRMSTDMNSAKNYNFDAARATKSQFSCDKRVKYIEQHSQRLIPAQQKLIEATKTMPMGMMIGDTSVVQLLANMVKMIKGKRTLDVGVFTGYSAMSIALALPEDGKVIALDISKQFTDVGKPFWKEAGVDHKIDLRLGPAKESLERLVSEGQTGTFDYAFIDADKTGYDAYYELCLRLVRPGGFIAVDNVLWSGKVYNPEVSDTDTRAIREFNEKLHGDTRVDISMLNDADGVTLAFKK